MARAAAVTGVVVIRGIAAGGAGVGSLPDGRAAFVHRTAPGEEVEVRVLEEKRRWVRAELLRIRRAAPERRKAPCPHYERCGGCTLEHLHYEAQLRAKAQIVASALERIGGLQVEPPEVVPSPEEFRYRNRVSFTLARLKNGRVVAGFHELNRPARIFDITEACLLPELPITAAWQRLRAEWGPNASRLPSGRRLRLTLRAARNGQVALLIEGGYSDGWPAELAARVPQLVALWHRAAGTTEPKLLAGSEVIHESWEDEDVALTGAVFLQVNRGAAARLEEYVAELAGAVAGRKIVDAYCGVGFLARRLARQGAEVVGLELDPAAVQEAQRHAPENARFQAGAVERLLPDSLPAALLVLNPPRSGLEASIPATILRQPPERIVYVSCDPATLARDLSRLASGYRLRSLRCFDLFPQTAHVETVAELTCATT